ncbi:hypothetical protein EI74_0363 [Mycoplasma testudineum]|uniref:Uncharacterized protein n=1 Tax=Mycoplasma testudineum TaxID=244584 RepID=A0A4R6IFV2_9MOLU|nr:hypothetical protein [Mycoplasma testudineum]OYD26981.1 hypothetical protein CG473_01440 [Mycoplasma testudineum]TDO20527.1 hypothetical protein EI74_0363 [Mycoplasma testudineum]
MNDLKIIINGNSLLWFAESECLAFFSKHNSDNLNEIIFDDRKLTKLNHFITLSKANQLHDTNSISLSFDKGFWLYVNESDTIIDLSDFNPTIKPIKHPHLNQLKYKYRSLWNQFLSNEINYNDYSELITDAAILIQHIAIFFKPAILHFSGNFFYTNKWIVKKSLDYVFKIFSQISTRKIMFDYFDYSNIEKSFQFSESLDLNKKFITKLIERNN